MEVFLPKYEAHARGKFFSIYKPTAAPLLLYTLIIPNQHDLEFSGREESDLVLRIEVCDKRPYTDDSRFSILKRKSAREIHANGALRMLQMAEAMSPVL